MTVAQHHRTTEFGRELLDNLFAHLEALDTDMWPNVGVERVRPLPFLCERARSDRSDMGNGSTPSCVGDYETTRRRKGEKHETEILESKPARAPGSDHLP